MNYDLAKRLKDCVDCKNEFLGGNRASRCKPCQKAVRTSMNKAWQKKYYLAQRSRIIKRQVARQGVRRLTDPMFREQEKTKYHKRRSLIEGNGGTHTTNEWLSLVSLFGGKCADCKETKSLTRDHIIPLSRGGTNDITNIQPLCGSCNSSKGAKLVYA